MLTRSATYNSIMAGQHSVEWKITVNGTVYGMTDIAGDMGGGIALPRLGRHMFPGNEPVVGSCVAATFECAIFEASANVPRMATVVPAYRITNGTLTSEWITLGTFYIDTRSVDKSTGALSLYCYDRMLVADGVEGKCYADVTGFSTWPQSMSAVVNEICTIMGVTLDSRTTINTGTGYMVDYPNDYTMREVLGYIAAAHCGNWTITADNKLRLIPITGGTDTYNLGPAASSLSAGPALTAWSGVTVYWGDEEAYQAGTDTGRVLTTDCPWATQATANGMLTVISGKQYQPYTASGAFPDLALELGDIVTVGLTGDTVTGPVFAIDITADVIEAADLSAPGEAEVDHEYPYSDYVDRTLQRKVSLGQSYYGTTISREKGLEIKRSDGKSEVIMNSDLLAFKAKIDGVMRDRIYFDPIKGDYVFDGALGADAILAGALYAETGDIAELTVDRVSTSRRIRKYILEDTSDDNYIQIQDNYERFVTGTPISSDILLTEAGDAILTEAGLYLTGESNDLAVEQAKNRNNQPLYWQREPVSHTADGYPLDADGRQIYATTDETDWPVYVYVYLELTKAQESFEIKNGEYVPIFSFGAGDENGRNKGYIQKTQDGLDIVYTPTAGGEIGIKALADGYMDLYGLRKPTELDFSNWDNGLVTETLDGDGVSSWIITFDANDRPIKFVDGDGHETDVVWEASP